VHKQCLRYSCKGSLVGVGTPTTPQRLTLHAGCPQELAAAAAAVEALQARLAGCGHDAGAARELETALETEAEAVDRCRAAADEMAGQLGGGCSQTLNAVLSVCLLHILQHVCCPLLL
jgi:hypothetical protein